MSPGHVWTHAEVASFDGQRRERDEARRRAERAEARVAELEANGEKVIAFAMEQHTSALARIAELEAALRAWVEHEEGYGPNPLGKTRAVLAGGTKP